MFSQPEASSKTSNPQFFAGAAVEDITPSEIAVKAGRMHLAGYVLRASPATAILNPLSARALALRDLTGHTVILVSMDVAGVEMDFTEKVRGRIAALCGVPALQVLLHCTHTHTSPVTRRWLTFPPGQHFPDAGYLHFLEQATIRAAQRALAHLQPASLFFARGASDIGYNRHAPGGFYDRTLDVLKVTAADGQVIATSFFHGCHPVSMGVSTQISPDFPGVARDVIEAIAGGVGFFFQGFGGTIDPHSQGNQETWVRGNRGPDLTRQLGTQIAGDVLRLLDGPMKQIGGPLLSRSTTLSLPFQPVQGLAELLEDRDKPPHRDVAPEAIRRWAQWTLAQIARGMVPAGLHTELHLIQAGSGPSAWRLVACAHEVVSDFAPRVRAVWPGAPLTLMGYTGAVDGYLPTAAILNEPCLARFPHCRNYEGSKSFMYYGLPAPLVNDVDARFLGAVSSLTLE